MSGTHRRGSPEHGGPPRETRRVQASDGVQQEVDFPSRWARDGAGGLAGGQGERDAVGHAGPVGAMGHVRRPGRSRRGGYRSTAVHLQCGQKSSSHYLFAPPEDRRAPNPASRPPRRAGAAPHGGRLLVGRGAAGPDPTAVATTSILGDVVENVVGDAAEVVVLMPAGSAPRVRAVGRPGRPAPGGRRHRGQRPGVEGPGDAPSTPPSRPASCLRRGTGRGPAAAGRGAATGAASDPTCSPTWRMAQARENIAAASATVPALDTAEVRAQASAYAAELLARRRGHRRRGRRHPGGPAGALVTNHEVLSTSLTVTASRSWAPWCQGHDPGRAELAGGLSDPGRHHP